MSENTQSVEIDACPNDCGDHCGNLAWTPLAEHLRVGHDVLPEERRYQDTWLHIALLADEWFAERSVTSPGRSEPTDCSMCASGCHPIDCPYSPGQADQ